MNESALVCEENGTSSIDDFGNPSAIAADQLFHALTSLRVELAVLFNDRVCRESQPSLFFILEVPRLPPVGVSLRILRDQSSLRLDEGQRGEAHFLCGVLDMCVGPSPRLTAPRSRPS